MIRVCRAVAPEAETVQWKNIDMTTDNTGYRDSGSLAKWVRWFLYLQIAVAVASLVSGILEYRLLTAYETGAYVSEAQAIADGEASDLRQGTIALICIAVYIVTGILILKWIYRANYNARQLGAESMKFTPGWSVCWFFVPIASWWKPYQAMSEIWKASMDPANWQNTKAGAILPWWWFFWLVNIFLGNAVARLSFSAEEMSALKMSNVMYQVSDLVLIVLTLVTLSMIGTIQKAQVAHASGGEKL